MAGVKAAPKPSLTTDSAQEQTHRVLPKISMHVPTEKERGRQAEEVKRNLQVEPSQRRA